MVTATRVAMAMATRWQTCDSSKGDGNGEGDNVGKGNIKKMADNIEGNGEGGKGNCDGKKGGRRRRG